MSWRRLAVLLRQLPNDSATKCAERPDAQWTPEAHLLAALVDLQRFDMWRTSNPKKRGPKPTPLPRPGQATKQEARTADMRRRLLEQRERLVVTDGS